MTWDIPTIITLGVTITLSLGIILFVLFFLINKNKKKVQIPLFGSKGSLILGGSEEETMQSLQDNYIPKDIFNKVILLSDSEKTKVYTLKEDFTSRSLRDCESEMGNLLEELHSKMDSTFVFEVDFMHSFKSFAQEELLKIFRGMIKANHLAERKPGTPEREEFVEEKSQSIFWKTKNIYIEHWPSYDLFFKDQATALKKENKRRNIIPSREELKGFFGGEVIKDTIVKQMKKTITNIMDNALTYHNENIRRREEFKKSISTYLNNDEKMTESVLLVTEL